MQNTSRTSMLDSEIVAAWQEQMGLVVNTPDLVRDSMPENEQLLPRFAAYYTYLRALPRRARKALQRQWRMPLPGVALMLALGQSPGLAATIPVGGSCTLVNAITAANTDAATGGCPGGSGADTIVLPPGSTQTLNSVINNTYPPTGLPVINSTITIEGQGSTIRRDSAVPEFRILAVSSTGDLTMRDTTVSGGGGDSLNGTGVYNNGTLTVLNSNISGNFGGGLANGNSGMATVTSSTISNNTADRQFFFFGGGVFNSGTLILLNSTISGNSGGGVWNNYNGTLTVVDSTISGNVGDSGAGVFNAGTGTVLNSTISDNSVPYPSLYGIGGGLRNLDGTLTVLNSTISSNVARYGGGVGNPGVGLLTVVNSTISGNSAHQNGGGVVNGIFYGPGILTLVRTLVTGNTAPTASEIYNNALSGYGTVVANNHNLFGLNGNAGVEGFTPGLTDIVPPPGVQLADILNPVLSFNGGPTQTHALVPSSPAIDAGGPVCTDTNGNPLLTDQRGKPRIIDGNRDGTARCDIGAFEFFPIVNNLVTLDSGLDTSFDSTPLPGALAGTFTIGATFTNSSGTALRFPFFTVTELSGGNLLLNAAEGPQGVGATLNPNVGDRVLSPGETVNVDFVIGLQTSRPFTFLVDLFAAPLVSGAATSRHRPNTTTKTGRR